MAQGTVGAQTRAAQGRFMDQMQCQSGFQRFVGLCPRPAAEQIPGAQAQVLGHEQPQPQEIAGNLIGQALPDLSFEGASVGGLGAGFASRALRGQKPERGFGVEAIEFFFAGRNRR